MPVQARSLTMQVGPRITSRIAALLFSGNYPTGGDTLDLTNIDNTGLNRIDGFQAFTLAAIKIIYDLAASGGYWFEVIRGTTLKNWKVKVYQASGAELSAGAYPAALTAPPQNESFAIGIETVSGK